MLPEPASPSSGSAPLPPPGWPHAPFLQPVAARRSSSAPFCHHIPAGLTDGLVTETTHLEMHSGCVDLIARLLIVLFLPRPRLAQREDRSRGGRGDPKSPETPRGSCLGPTGEVVDRDLPGTRERKGDRRSDDQEIELIATTHIEEPPGPMDGRDRHEHHAGYRGRPEGREQAESEKRAASELGDPGDGRIHPTGSQARGLEPAPRAGEAMATEPPEQLLGPVRRHDRS